MSNLKIALTGILIGSIAIGLYNPVTVILLEKINTSSWVIGLITTMGNVSVVLFSSLTARLIDKYGLKEILFSGLVITIIGTIGHILYYNIFLLSIIKLLTGIGWTFIFVATEVLINLSSDDKDRGKNIGLYVILLSTGIAIGTLLIFTIHFGDWVPFIICSLIMTTAFIFQLFFLQKVSLPPPGKNIPKLSIFKMPLVSLVSPLLYGFFESGYVVVIPLYALRMGFSENDVSFLLGSFVLGGIVVLYYVSKLSDKFSQYRLLIILSLFLAVLFIAPIFISAIAGLLLIFFIIGGFVPAFYTVGLNFTINTVDKKYLSQANGHYISLYGIGAVLGPLISSMLIDVDLDLGYWLTSSIICFSFFLLFFIRGFFTRYLFNKA